MHSISTKFLLLVLLMGLLLQSHKSTVVSAQNPKDVIPGVHEITGDTFPSVVHPDMKYYVLLVFYADWCGQCKKFLPNLIQFGKVYEESSETEVKSRVILTKSDAIANSALAEQYQVTGFPTILLFSPGEEAPLRFSGAREPHHLSAFLSAHIPDFPELVRPPEPENVAYVQELTVKNFEEVALNKEKVVVVLFYAPWCGFCKLLQPIYQKLAEIFQNDAKNVVIARIDASELAAQDITAKYVVRSFPTIFLFPTGEEKVPIRFQEKRTLGHLLRFVNGHTVFPRLLDGEMSWFYGVLPDVSKQVAHCAFDQETEEGNQACRIAKELLKEKEGATGYEIYEKVIEAITDNSADAASFISREVEALSNKRMSLPKGVERDEVTLRLNIWSDLYRHF